MKKRLVIKIGSAILTKKDMINEKRLKKIVKFIFQLRQNNYEVIVVSSGAVASGYTELKLDKNRLNNKQALASIGQPLLMAKFKKAFDKFDIICSQFLIEATVFKDKIRLDHAKDTIEALIKNSVVPIINENDTTYTDELEFGDNDQLAGFVAVYFDAMGVLILSDIDGYYDKNPQHYKDAKLIKKISKIPKKEMIKKPTQNSQFSTGGIVTKLKAAHYLIKHNKFMLLTTGFELKIAKNYFLKNIHNGGTIFQK